jgi:LPXTG-motif cell wall-anchored protein
MTCDPLPNTGLGASVLPVLAIGAVCLVVGLGILLVRRRRGRATATLLLFLIIGWGAAMVLVPSSPAEASPADCTADPGNNSLTITQTSTMEGLAPGVEPADITGLVVNNGPDSTFIVAIVVEIVEVIIESDSVSGSCDATDYALLDPRMPVNRTLGPGGSTTFTGASIGFSDKSTNQDTCQRATIRLHYSTVPE